MLLVGCNRKQTHLLKCLQDYAVYDVTVISTCTNNPILISFSCGIDCFPSLYWVHVQVHWAVKEIIRRRDGLQLESCTCRVVLLWHTLRESQSLRILVPDFRPWTTLHTCMMMVWWRHATPHTAHTYFPEQVFNLYLIIYTGCVPSCS